MLSMRPAQTEFEPFYADYVACIEDGHLLETLAAQPAALRALLASCDEDEAALPSAPGKWSLKDVINHMIDAERVFACRLLWFARQPGAVLPGFDQDTWVPTAVAHRRPLSDLFDEFDVVRGATCSLLRSLPADAAGRAGRANGHQVTVRALAWIIAGHAQRHIDLLRQRYASQT